MAFKFISFLALVAATQAGVLSPHHSYSDAPSVSYSSVSTPEVSYGGPSYAKAAAPVHYAAAPAIQAAAPVSYSAPVAYAAPAIKVAAPVYKVAKQVITQDYSTPAHYDFSYGVEDPHTGDVKSQHETREGDVVKGSYSLIEADGTKRIVEYTVDGHSGFNAVVHREPAAHPVKAIAPVAAKFVAPVGYAQPVVKAVAPVAYAQPVLKAVTPVAYAQPVLNAVAPVAYAQPIVKASYASPLVAKVPALNKVTYSSAPEVSYSSFSGPEVHAGPSYYHH
ncbi:cuticle protein 21-like [Diabrotica virgifera virgifera]|uniref:Cuticle protein 21-like n=1 Tax=Diabrotica virgifera virgifera TaxID=50390 RepID=A0ABM5IMH1_DIAVI|nr:cuticle protein 21-like [Diabrotica virgifera virgifera]